MLGDGIIGDSFLLKMFMYYLNFQKCIFIPFIGKKNHKRKKELFSLEHFLDANTPLPRVTHINPF